MTAAGSEAGTGQAGQPGTGEQAEQAAPAPPAPPAPREPGQAVPPEQSHEDTDIAWGDYSGRDDVDRLYRDRPPHWADY
jgi:hypothetical protein